MEITRTGVWPKKGKTVGTKQNSRAGKGRGENITWIATVVSNYITWLQASECQAKIRLAIMSSAVMVVAPLPTTPTKARVFCRYAC